MKRFVLLLLLAPVSLSAQPAIHVPAVNTSSLSALLDGPTEGAIGQRIDINVLGLPPVDLEKPLGLSLAWLEAMQFKLDAQPGDMGRLSGGLTFDVIQKEWRLVLSFTPRYNGTYVVVFVQRDKPDISTHRVTVGIAPLPPITPPITPPNPPPLPPPGPSPVPEGKYGFGPISYRLGSGVAAAYRTKSIELADNFEAIASAIAAGATKTAQDAIREVGAKNALTLTDPAASAAWLAFRTGWKENADKHNTAGTLRNLASDYAEAFRETATGLRAVR